MSKLLIVVELNPNLIEVNQHWPCFSFKWQVFSFIVFLVFFTSHFWNMLVLESKKVKLGKWSYDIIETENIFMAKIKF